MLAGLFSEAAAVVSPSGPALLLTSMLSRAPPELAMMVPVSPTATQAELEAQLTASRLLSVPELCCDQVVPPSLVALIVATFISRPMKYSPLTVTHVEAVGQLTPLNCPSVPLVDEYCRDHVVPPSVVAVIWPMVPPVLS